MDPQRAFGFRLLQYGVNLVLTVTVTMTAYAITWLNERGAIDGNPAVLFTDSVASEQALMKSTRLAGFVLIPILGIVFVVVSVKYLSAHADANWEFKKRMLASVYVAGLGLVLFIAMSDTFTEVIGIGALSLGLVSLVGNASYAIHKQVTA